VIEPAPEPTDAAPEADTESGAGNQAEQADQTSQAEGAADPE
jgi:hypothetical protein